MIAATGKCQKIWKRHYPKTLNSDRIVALVIKGEHLDNLDTVYKRKLLAVLFDNFDWSHQQDAGKLELAQTDGATMECKLILMSDLKFKLPEVLT